MVTMAVSNVGTATTDDRNMGSYQVEGVEDEYPRKTCMFCFLMFVVFNGGDVLNV